MSASLKRRTAIGSGIHGKDNTLRGKFEASDLGRININQKEQFLHHGMLLVCIIIAYIDNATTLSLIHISEPTRPY